MNKKEIDELKEAIGILEQLELDVSEEIGDIEVIERIREKRENLISQLESLTDKHTSSSEDEIRKKVQEALKKKEGKTKSKKKPMLYSTPSKTKGESHYEELSDSDLRRLCLKASDVIIRSGSSR